jgi:hypothetical protein
MDVTAAATVGYAVLTVGILYIMWLQTREQRKAVDLQMFHELAARMEEARPLRQIVRSYVKLKRESETKIFPLPDDIKEAVDKICREFDYLGLLDHNRVVDSRLVDRFYAVPFVLLYKDVLEIYVNELRRAENRGPTHFWELVQFYERVKDVPKKHPGLTGKPDWPEDARTTSRAEMGQESQQRG